MINIKKNVNNICLWYTQEQEQQEQKSDGYSTAVPISYAKNGI